MIEPKRVAIMVGTDSAYGREILRGVRDYTASQRLGWHFFVSRERDLLHLSRLGDWRGHGLITSYFHQAEVDELRAKRLAVVSVSSQHAETTVPRAIPDHVAIGRAAAEHLLEHGLLAGAGVGIQQHAGWGERLAGFRETMHASGAMHCPEIGLSSSDLERDRLALVPFLRTLPRPAGVFVFNDTIALQLLAAADLAGLRVPDDLAVIGVDDDDLICEFANPPITSIDPNARRVGYEAARLLDAAMAAGADAAASPPPTVRVPPIGPIVRQSTEILAIDDALVAQAIRLIWQQAGEDIGIPQILEQLPAARRSVERRFVAALGRSPAAELWRVRLEKARRLLITSDLPVVEVAARCSFKHQSHLNAAIRRRWNTTPLELRAAHRVTGRSAPSRTT